MFGSPECGRHGYGHWCDRRPSGRLGMRTLPRWVSGGLTRKPPASETCRAIHFIGACLATGNLLLTAGTVLITFPALYLRAAAEERLLRASHGPAYDANARRVPMLIPVRLRNDA